MKDRTMRVGVLNVAAQPHSAEIYSALLTRARRRRIGGRLWGDRFGMLASLEREGASLLLGVINTYVDFDPKAPWLNLTRGEEANEADRNAIRLPDNLRPSLKRGFFAFDVKKHRFAYECDVGAPRSVQSMLDAILNHRRVLDDEVESVTVTVEQERESLDKIYAMSALRHLVITLAAPNSDDMAEEEEAFEKRLLGMQAKRMTIALDVKRGASLNPDEQTRSLARIATSNGFVKGSGTDADGVAREISTLDHPVIQSGRYNPKQESGRDVFVRLVHAVFDLVRRR